MRYLVRARAKAGRAADLIAAIDTKTLGEGSVAGGEYLRNMTEARLMPDGTVRWVEACFCPTPLLEERPYWEEFFDLIKVQDAHARDKCRDANGSDPWACSGCDCTARLEARLARTGEPFVPRLRSAIGQAVATDGASIARPFASHSAKKRKAFSCGGSGARFDA